MNYRHIGVLLLITTCSYFFQTLYWVVRSLRLDSAILSNPSEFSNILRTYNLEGFSILLAVAAFIFGIVPLAIRFFGAINAVSASYVVWRKGRTAIPSVKGRIANALFCEGLYWSFFIPTLAVVFENARSLISSMTAQFLALSYSLQILLITPFLIVLSFKFRRRFFDLDAIAKSRLVWIALITYIAALWGNYTLRWSEVIVYRGLNGLLIENTYIGFFNSVITLFLAVYFAVAASLPVLKKSGGPKMKWLGLSLTFLGLHFLIHILYTAYSGIPTNTSLYRLMLMMMSDVWPVAALGLGLYLYLTQRALRPVKNETKPSKYN